MKTNDVYWILFPFLNQNLIMIYRLRLLLFIYCFKHFIIIALPAALLVNIN